MTGGIFCLPALRCINCSRCYVPAPLGQRRCEICTGRMARRLAADARQASVARTARQAAYWRAWKDREIDAIDNSEAVVA